MNRKNAKRVGWLAVGLMACLTVSACRTCEKPQCIANGRVTIEDVTLQKMRRIVIPELSFRPPDTIITAVDFFKQASLDFDKPDVPLEERGVGFIVNLPLPPNKVMATTGEDPFAMEANAIDYSYLPVIPAIRAHDINLYDTLKLVCDVIGMQFKIQSGFIMIAPLDDPDSGWQAQADQLSPSLGACSFTTSGDTADGIACDGTEHDGWWKPYFEKFGVTWPPEISPLPQGASGMWMQITRGNFDMVRHIPKDSNRIPQLINIDMQAVAFRAEDIEKLRLAAGVSKESLMVLRKEGNAKLVATTQTLIASGHEETVKVARDVLYSTEMNGTGQNEDSGISSVIDPFTPCNHDRGGSDMVLQVEPKRAGSNGTRIHLMFNPQWVALNRWETFPVNIAGKRTHKTLPFRQSAFVMTNFDTRLTVEDGETVLLGGCATPDGEWVYYGFLTATLTNVEPETNKETEP